jgi:hypothetical protein
MKFIVILLDMNCQICNHLRVMTQKEIKADFVICVYC